MPSVSFMTPRRKRLKTTRRGESISLVSTFMESRDTDAMTSNLRFLQEIDPWPTACIVPNPQLLMSGCVAHYPEAGQAHRVVSVEDKVCSVAHTWNRNTPATREVVGCSLGMVILMSKKLHQSFDRSLGRTDGRVQPCPLSSLTTRERFVNMTRKWFHATYSYFIHVTRQTLRTMISRWPGWYSLYQYHYQW